MLLNGKIPKKIILCLLLFAIASVAIIPAFAAQVGNRNEKNQVENISCEREALADEDQNHIAEIMQYEIKNENNAIIRISIGCTYYLHNEIDKLEVVAEAIDEGCPFTWRTASIDDDGANIELCYFDGAKNNVLLFDLKLDEDALDISYKKIGISNDAYWPPWTEDKMVALNTKYHDTSYDVEQVMSEINQINNGGE